MGSSVVVVLLKVVEGGPEIGASRKEFEGQQFVAERGVTSGVDGALGDSQSCDEALIRFTSVWLLTSRTLVGVARGLVGLLRRGWLKSAMLVTTSVAAIVGAFWLTLRAGGSMPTAVAAGIAMFLAVPGSVEKVRPSR